MNKENTNSQNQNEKKIDELTPQNMRKPFLQNITNIVKKGTNIAREKIGTFFNKKKPQVQSNNSSPDKEKAINITPGGDNKGIFRIEDEGNNEFSYHINDDEDEYEDDDEEIGEEAGEKTDEQAGVKKGRKESKELGSDKKDLKEVKEEEKKQEPQMKLNVEEEYDQHSVVHRIYYKVQLIF
jgi:hypothetical protein